MVKKRLQRLQQVIADGLGLNVLDEVDAAERVRHVQATSALGTVAGILFTGFNLSLPDMAGLGLAELFAVLAFYVPAAWLARNPTRVALAELFVLLGSVTISCALILFGGIEGTGLFWVFAIPFLTFFIKGQRQGWIYNLVFLSVHAACALFIAPAMPTGYRISSITVQQFVLALAFYVLVAAAFNRARVRFEGELHARKAEAEASNQAKSRFLAAASHDLRQPAHALGMFMARLQERQFDAQTAQLVAGAASSVRALQDMLDAFFDYSSLDKQLLHSTPHAFALNPIFDKLNETFSQTAANKNLRLRIRPTKAWVYSDPTLLHRILLNLLGNALQYTNAGTVLLACRVDSDEQLLRIEVRDSGIGISEADQEKIFDEFFQAANFERDRSKGLGLGLSIVKRTCELLQHNVAVRSQIGRGSVFTISLPCAQPKAEIKSSPEAADSAGFNSLFGFHVLVVEDDAQGSVALQGLLESWGCRVSLATTASDAMDLLDPKLPPDCVVADFRLPGPLTGLDVVSHIRKAVNGALPACIISGDLGREFMEAAREQGIVFLQKPVRAGKLRNVLRQFRAERSRMQLSVISKH